MYVFMLVCLSLRSELVCMCVMYACEFFSMYVSESVSMCVQVLPRNFLRW